MRYSLYFSGLLSIIILAACSSSSSSKAKGSGSSLLCTDEACVKSVCPSYSSQTNSSTDNNICKIVGACEIPNMPLTFQNLIPVNGALACGPTSMHMALDSLILNSSPVLSSWINTYSNLSTTSAVTGCSSSDMTCKKVVTVGNKLINGSWYQNGRPVSEVEVSSLFETVKAEISYPLSNPAKNSESFKTSVYPNDIKQCDFVAGSHAVSNSQIWNNVLLYLTYEEIVEGSSTYSGVPLIDIRFKPSDSGHFIAMNGYNTTTSSVLYKFHCPIYGIKWYSMKNVILNQPSCVLYNGTACTQYIRVTQLPQGFEDNNASNSFTYLLETAGEEVSQNYVYKIIAGISGVK
ncbi:MAG: hypothetical protein WCQ47_06070 [bacterium]